MSLQKPSIPKGTRDFSPLEMVRRNYIFDTIRKVFQLFGYQPIETPAMENLSTLLGKYGEEGDKLLFKILNSGDFLEGVESTKYEVRSTNNKKDFPDYKKLTPFIAEKGLRYDLTVPFARFVVQHQNEITFPFKRYQIQPVWRADRPQKGRYREFFQCDVDVIGSDSLLNEVELIQIIDAVFSCLGMKVEILLNNRKILAGIIEAINQTNNFTKVISALDKFDKKRKAGVIEELLNFGIEQRSVYKLFDILMQVENNDNSERLNLLDGSVGTKEEGHSGILELKKIFSYVEDLKVKAKILFDPTLARGLNYYTGTIIEVKALDVPIGSVCGGGRYDDLTGIFGLKGVSGVGISFGADRIYDVMNELDLFPEMIGATTKVLFVNFGAEEEKYCLSILSGLRESGIPAEIFPEAVKLKKQLDYANRKNIPFVVLVGENEMKEGMLTLKDMQTGEQKTVTWEQLKEKLMS